MKNARFLTAAVFLCASAVMAGELSVPNRLAVAKPGEWATYAVSNGYIQKQTVVSRSGEGPEASVTVKIENIFEGRTVTETEVVEEAGSPMREVERPPAGSGVSVEAKIIDMNVKGRTIPVTVLEFEYDDEDDDGEMKWFLSAEVPVYGIVRQETDDVVEFELLDYGME